MHSIRLQRIYADDHHDTGYRVLIDRLWPRGISKTRAGLDEWMKDIAPSPALRQAFHQQKMDFAAFRAAYRNELAQDSQKQVLLERLYALSGHRPVILLYGAKDPQQNHATVLLDYLKKRYAIATAAAD